VKGTIIEYQGGGKKHQRLTAGNHQLGVPSTLARRATDYWRRHRPVTAADHRHIHPMSGASLRALPEDQINAGCADPLVASSFRSPA
jgi:hypothetical protein